MAGPTGRSKFNVDAGYAMQIRAFREGDEGELFKIFHSSIHGLAGKDYSEEQIKAWAPKNLDQDVWLNRMQGISPFVVEYEGRLVAYADFQPSGYIDHFFVAEQFARKGIGSILMQHLHLIASERGIPELSSDVSRTAQPFFARFGFEVVEQRNPVIRGVVVPNALMHKPLEGAASRLAPLATLGAPALPR